MTSLEQLVVDLDGGPWWQDGTEWVQVMGPIEDHELVADADLDHLLGFVAPPRCSAIALTASGWARSMDLPPPIARAEQQRVRITCAVDRDGRVAGRIRWADGSHVDEPPSSGRSLDILRRCLGLPTDPPAVPSAQLLAAQWLAAVTRIARLRARPLRWEEVAAQHPAMLLAGPGGTAVRRGRPRPRRPGSGPVVDLERAVAPGRPAGALGRCPAAGDGRLDGRGHVLPVAAGALPAPGDAGGRDGGPGCARDEAARRAGAATDGSPRRTPAPPASMS